MSIQRQTDQPKPFPGFHSPNYTMVPDELFDELLPELSGAELKVLLYIVRRTFGFKRDSDTISINQMLHGITTRDERVLDRGVGLTKKTLLAAIRSLEERNVILTQQRRSLERGNEPTSYRLNVVEATLGGKITPPLGEKLHQGGGVEITPSPRGKNYPTQDTVLQETVEQEKALEISSGQSQKGKRDDDPKGMTSVGQVLAKRRTKTAPLDPRPSQPPSQPVPSSVLPDWPLAGTEEFAHLEYLVGTLRRELRAASRRQSPYLAPANARSYLSPSIPIARPSLVAGSANSG